MSPARWPKRAGIYMRPGKIFAPTWASRFGDDSHENERRADPVSGPNSFPVPTLGEKEVFDTHFHN